MEKKERGLFSSHRLEGGGAKYHVYSAEGSRGCYIMVDGAVVVCEEITLGQEAEEGISPCWFS